MKVVVSEITRDMVVKFPLLSGDQYEWPSNITHTLIAVIHMETRVWYKRKKSQKVWYKRYNKRKKHDTIIYFVTPNVRRIWELLVEKAKSKYKKSFAFYRVVLVFPEHKWRWCCTKTDYGFDNIIDNLQLCVNDNTSTYFDIITEEKDIMRRHGSIMYSLYDKLKISMQMERDRLRMLQKCGYFHILIDMVKNLFCNC